MRAQSRPVPQPKSTTVFILAGFVSMSLKGSRKLVHVLSSKGYRQVRTQIECYPSNNALTYSGSSSLTLETTLEEDASLMLANC